MIENYRQVNRVTCARCGKSVEPSETIYDERGNLVCRACHGAIEAAKAGEVMHQARFQTGGGWGASQPMSTGRMIWIGVVVLFALLKMCIIASR